MREQSAGLQFPLSSVGIGSTIERLKRWTYAGTSGPSRPQLSSWTTPCEISIPLSRGALSTLSDCELQLSIPSSGLARTRSVTAIQSLSCDALFRAERLVESGFLNSSHTGSWSTLFTVNLPFE